MTTQKRRRRWPWVFVVVLGALGGAFVVQQRNNEPEPVDEALLLTVKRATLALEIVETGRVAPREKVEVKSKVAGQVTAVLVNEGDLVKRGALLVTLDPTDFQREVARASANVAQAKNSLAQATALLNRKKAGVEDKLTPLLELDAAQFDVSAKNIALQSASIALETTRDQVRYTKILAPMDGTVIQRGIQPGEVVVPGVQSTFEGKALLTIADLSVLVAKVELNQIDIAKVRLGQTATLTLDALPGKSYEAKITKIAPASVKPPGKELEVFPIEAELSSSDLFIKPGMTADVRIHLESKQNVLSLPIEAIVKQDDKNYVTRVRSNAQNQQIKEKIEVSLGLRNDRDVEITSGIEENDKILISPGSASANETKM